MKFFVITRLFVLVFLFSGFVANAQKEANNWYFGNRAGLGFSGNANPAIRNDSKMKALEGCSVISDSLGKLLFYTAGDTVYRALNNNPVHQKMNNGWLLSGHQSASQSSIIIPRPYSNSIFYLFTIDALGGSNGLKYSLIDLNAISGQGSVIAKNIPLLTPVAEKITAVDHRNSRDVWVIVHGTSPQKDNFFAYRISRPSSSNPTGISGPVVSFTGASQSGAFPNDKAIGYLKASPDGQKLALAIQSINLVEVYDFNDSTGVVSNRKQLIAPSPYGIEFSRDGSKLYVTSQGNTQQIEQFNLSYRNIPEDSIQLSRKIVGSTPSVFPSAIQLAVNGKIYVANSGNVPSVQSLSVFISPDSLGGKAGFSQNSQQLNTSSTPPLRTSNQGLPNFNQSYFWAPSFRFKHTCIGDVTIFTQFTRRRFKSVTWNFGDAGSTDADNTSNLLNPVHQFPAPGTYNVTLTVVLLNNRVRSITIPVTINPLPMVNLGPDREICAKEKITLTGPEDAKKYLWSTGSDSSAIEIDKPGTYWLEIMNINGCKNRDSIVISYKKGPQIFKEHVVEICPFRPVKLRTSQKSNVYLWSGGSFDSTLTVSREGQYKVTIMYKDCPFSDSVRVVFKACPEDTEIPNIITPNGDNDNETFMLRGLLPGECELLIYNRWGTLIYEDKAYRNNWPKQAPPAGLYYYLLKKTGTDIKYRGWLEVVR